MTDAAAIRATYSDWRPVKSRKVLQLVMEVPIEQTEQVLQTLGAPMPDREMWVAIARLRDAPVEKSSVDPMVREAGILCKDARFQRFLADKFTEGLRENVNTEEWAADLVRVYCVIESRTELATNADARAKWLELKRDYNAWSYI